METSNLNYKPLGATIVITLPEISEKKEAGIIKSEEMIAKERNDWDGSAEIIATGPDCKYCQIGYKVLLQDQAVMNPISKKLENTFQVDEYYVLGYFE